MYADRYAKSGIKPGSLSIAIALNGAILAALIFAAPAITPPIDRVFEGIHIPLPLPEPVEPEPQPKAKARPEQKIVKPLPPERPFVPDSIRPLDTTEAKLVGGPAIDPGPLLGNGEGGTVIDPPRAPVLIGAQPDPNFARLFQPTYPAEERRAGNEGRVVVRVLIGVDGRVKQIERVSAASEAFFEVTRRRAFDKWRFRPATRDGIPHEAWRIMSVSFVLSENS